MAQTLQSKYAIIDGNLRTLLLCDRISIALYELSPKIANNLSF